MRSTSTSRPTRARDARDDAPFDADEFYALSVLHMTVGRVRKHLLQEGKSEHWMIFEELALAPLVPGRVAKTRDELLAMFPGEGPAFLDNRMTTVKRVFRRILPALIPVDPDREPDARAAVPGAAGRSSTPRRTAGSGWPSCWTRRPAPRSPTGSSLDLAAWTDRRRGARRGRVRRTSSTTSCGSS